ncbi:MAG: hypothetical protein GEU98_16270 [Pseudonocardiaceae bacterium]|nr:hypothetical protein [Pseudonocardiaceae bacterium]
MTQVGAEHNRSKVDRAAFRAFVRMHHPDVGGDPEVFIAGVNRFNRGENPFAAQQPPKDRYDAPIEVVRRPQGFGWITHYLRRLRDRHLGPPRVR